MVARRAGVHREVISTLERGSGHRLRLETIEAVLSAIGARCDLRVMWNGPELDRLLDAGHAAMGAVVKRRLERWGWIVMVEVSYSRYGERGRIDLLAWHPPTRIVLVVELKTALVDVQDLLGTLDAKARLSRHVAGTFGWEVRSVVPVIAFMKTRTTQRRLAGVDVLFDRFELRGRKALTWLRRPSRAVSGLMWFVDVPPKVARPVYRVRPRQRRAAA